MFGRFLEILRKQSPKGVPMFFCNFHSFSEQLLTDKVCFREKGHECGISKTGNILVNLRQLEDESPSTVCKFKVFGI